MTHTDLYIILSLIFLCALSVFVSSLITKSRIKKYDAHIKEKLDNINKNLCDTCTDCISEIDVIKKDITSLKDEMKKLPGTITVSTDEKLTDMQNALSQMNNRLNVLDSTVKNIEHMKDVEINGEKSRYFFDDENKLSKSHMLKDKVKAGYDKAVDMTSKIDLDTVVKAAPAVVKTVKTILKK